MSLFLVILAAGNSKRLKSNIGTLARVSESIKPAAKTSAARKPVHMIGDVHPWELPNVIVNKKVSNVKKGFNKIKVLSIAIPTKIALMILKKGPHIVIYYLVHLQLHLINLKILRPEGNISTS